MGEDVDACSDLKTNEEVGNFNTNNIKRARRFGMDGEEG